MPSRGGSTSTPHGADSTTLPPLEHTQSQTTQCSIGVPSVPAIHYADTGPQYPCARVDVDTPLIHIQPPRLIDPSPPRCITLGEAFVSSRDSNPRLRPAGRGVVEGLADKMSQQTLETQQPGRWGDSSGVPGFDLIADSFPLANPDSFPYPLELEIDPDSENLELWRPIIVKPPIIRPDTPSPTNPYMKAPVCDSLDAQDSITTTNYVSGKSTKRIMTMIQTETQCCVYDPPPSTPVSISMPSMPAPPYLPSMAGMLIEADDAPLDLACTDLEVDDNPEGDDMSWMDSIVTLRRAAGPGGVTKHGLRYRPSQEAALRCTNLVRSVPRMRRRKKVKTTSHQDHGQSTVHA